MAIADGRAFSRNAKALTDKFSECIGRSPPSSEAAFSYEILLSPRADARRYTIIVGIVYNERFSR